MRAGLSAFDLIVVGAGTAGIPAAMEAADHGARVVLVEKRPAVGGTLHVTSGYFSGAGSRRQRERGIRDSVEEHIADVMQLGHGKANEALVRHTVARQGEMVDWLDDLGFDFHPDAPAFYFGHELYQIPRTYFGRGRLSLLTLFAGELDRRVAAGTVDLRLRTAVSGLLRDTSGRVTGVAVAPLDERGAAAGEPYEISGAATLLATGGYGANRQLVARLLPPGCGDALSAGFAGATGDGLILAEKVGAALTSFGYYIPTMGLIPDPDRPGFACDHTEASAILVPSVRPPHEVWVNLRGERFVAEDVASPEARERALLEQPGLAFAIVWDQYVMDTADPIIGPPERGWTRERIAGEAERGRVVWKAETIEELAGLLGVDAAALARTVQRYNRAVDARDDPDFGRRVLPVRLERAPYYGLISRAGFLTAREGLRVNEDLQVLDRSDQPIPGLYATGEVLGASQFMGDNVVGGMGISPAITLGRLLGQRLAEEALRRRTTAVRTAG